MRARFNERRVFLQKKKTDGCDQKRCGAEDKPGMTPAACSEPFQDEGLRISDDDDPHAGAAHHDADGAAAPSDRRPADDQRNQRDVGAGGAGPDQEGQDQAEVKGRDESQGHHRQSDQGAGGIDHDRQAPPFREGAAQVGEQEVADQDAHLEEAHVGVGQPQVALHAGQEGRVGETSESQCGELDQETQGEDDEIGLFVRSHRRIRVVHSSPKGSVMSEKVPHLTLLSNILQDRLRLFMRV